MSNGLAVAAVTTTLRFVLDRALQQPHPGPVGGARTTTLRPDRLNTADLAGDPCLNLFLYRVCPNRALDHQFVPTRRADGSLAQRPTAVLDLHYLITCHGNDDSLDAQRLLGSAVIAFAATPVMTRGIVSQALTAYAGEPTTTFLAEADLADQVESVRMEPSQLSLEELSKVWSIMLQTSYQLSLTYTARAVVLQPDVTPQAVLPVRSRALVITAGGPPRLDTVSTDPPGGPTGSGSTLVLTGGHLLPAASPAPGAARPEAAVRIGPTLLAPAAGATPEGIRVTLDASVPAGLHRLQVIHRRPAVAGGEPARALATSNAVPVLVRPDVSVQSTGPAEVTLAVDPPLFAGQRATVTLQSLPGTAGPARTVSIDLLPVLAGSPAQSAVVLPRSDIPDGSWLLSLQVDGAQSVPELVGDTYGAPALTLP